jgi:NAD-reducing hydrogenase large subunit
MANLIVSTTNNNQAMNTAVREVASSTSTATKSPKACSTTSRWPSAPTTPACPAPPMRSAMPLEVTLIDAEGNELDKKYKQ